MFTLEIAITSARIAAIKAELTQTLPNVKSSHRCEAMARGLGFRTHASLRAALRTPAPIVVTVSGARFSGYLANHQFDVPPKPLYRAVARVALGDVMEKVPKLTTWGVGVGEHQRKSDGKWESWSEMRERFAKAREELLSDYSIERFLLSLAFLSRVKPTKTIRRGTGSYRLKHIAENYICTYPEGGELGPQYVPNGLLIAAAVHAGFNIKTYTDEYGRDSLNVSFNMSTPSLDDLDCEIRPNGATAQERRCRAEMRKSQMFRYSRWPASSVTAPRLPRKGSSPRP